jgi:apolipoprotein D and lipocalin family protein
MKNFIKMIFLSILILGFFTSCELMNTQKVPNASVLATEGESKEPAVVPALDPKLYAGRWLEVAHKPTFFQRNCVRSIADYAVLDALTLSVKNTCIKNDGSTSDISGKAKIQEATVPAKLKVDFGYFRTGQYWVVALEKDYKWAVVSNSDKSSLFILARQVPLDEKILIQIIEDLKARGFETADLVYDKY